MTAAKRTSPRKATAKAQSEAATEAKVTVAPEHAVVYDKKLHKVYFVTDPRVQSVELKGFIDELNEKYPSTPRYEMATVARTRHYAHNDYDSRTRRNPIQLEQQFYDYVNEHPEFRLELAWSYSKADFTFGYPRVWGGPGNPKEKKFCLLGSIQAFAQRAGVPEDAARIFVRARLVEVAGEDFVAMVAPELSVPIGPDKPEEALSA